LRFARSFVLAAKHGTLSPAWPGAEAIGRSIARLYGIPYTAFYHQTGAGNIIDSYADEKVARLSTAPVAIAWRFAGTGTWYGEVATQLNDEARLTVGARRRRLPFRDYADQYAWELADLPNRLPDPMGGSIIQLWVDARDVPAQVRQVVRFFIAETHTRTFTTEETLRHWNGEYIDIKIEHRKVQDARIIWVTPGTFLDGYEE